MKILGVYTFFSFNNHYVQSHQKKQRLEGIDRHQLGTAKGDSTDDI